MYVRTYNYTVCFFMATLASGIDVGQRINVGPEKYGKKDKRRALNTHI